MLHYYFKWCGCVYTSLGQPPTHLVHFVGKQPGRLDGPLEVRTKHHVDVDPELCQGVRRLPGLNLAVLREPDVRPSQETVVPSQRETGSDAATMQTPRPHYTSCY